MNIRALRDYFDREEGKPVSAGTEYSVTAERGNQIIGKGLAEEIKEVKSKPRKEKEMKDEQQQQ